VPLIDAGDDDVILDLEDYANLVAVARFARSIDCVPWFGALGKASGDATRADAEAYLAALGFPDVFVGEVPGWEEAEAAATNPDWNPDWWEAEEQLRAGLTADAVGLVGETELATALTHITAQAAEVIPDAAQGAAAHTGLTDDELVRAAVGSATQACYNAALVLAAAAEPDHAFALKFRLFEAGHWPIGIIGVTFHLF
jgi:hypothetical protein